MQTQEMLNFLLYFSGSCSSKCQHWHPRQLITQIFYREIRRSEIMAPLAHAMGLVHGDERDVEAAQALDETQLVSSEPVTVVLSKRGFARAAKGHEIDTLALSYK